MNGLQISKETYLSLTPTEKDAILFDLIKHSYDCTNEIKKCLAKKKKTDTFISGASGFVGGLVAVLGKSLWK